MYALADTAEAVAVAAIRHGLKSSATAKPSDETPRVVVETLRPWPEEWIAQVAADRPAYAIRSARIEELHRIMTECRPGRFHTFSHSPCEPASMRWAARGKLIAVEIDANEHDGFCGFRESTDYDGADSEPVRFDTAQECAEWLKTQVTP